MGGGTGTTSTRLVGTVNSAFMDLGILPTGYSAAFSSYAGNILDVFSLWDRLWVLDMDLFDNFSPLF